MLKLFIVSFVFVFIIALSMSFDGVQASKRAGRESMAPMSPYQYSIISPSQMKSEGNGFRIRPDRK